jgi:type VI secretion system protein ImpM
MSEAILSAAPGWYGKLPNVGDFASRRLPEGVIRVWDEWLQQGLASAREDLGVGWLEAYLVAPIMRFWLGPEVLGASPWAGLVMPSVDRVGRYFPLTLAQPCGALPQVLAARAWFAALDQAARRVLDVEFTIDDFERELAQVAPGEGGDASTAEHAAAVLQSFGDAARLSIWWCGDAGEGTRFRTYEGLPPPSAFASLLGGAP